MTLHCYMTGFGTVGVFLQQVDVRPVEVREYSDGTYISIWKMCTHLEYT